MKFKRLFLLAIGAAFLLTSAGKPMATANEIGGIKENFTQQVMRLANLASDEEETEERTLNGFNHYHVFEYQQFKDGTFGYDEVKKGSIRKAHSFFGLMYFRWPNGSIETFPTNP